MNWLKKIISVNCNVLSCHLLYSSFNGGIPVESEYTFGDEVCSISSVWCGRCVIWMIRNRTKDRIMGCKCCLTLLYMS